ncbi:MAG: hypothetical protein U0840_21505 [Gemmataceae bacterium]
MKQTQLTIAVVLLAAMVFVASFAMHYLGGTAPAPRVEPDQTGSRRELIFANRVLPEEDFATIEKELRSEGEQDFWFYNPYDKSLKVGLINANCKCTSVEIHALSSETTQQLLGDKLKAVENGPSLHPLLAPLRSRTDLPALASHLELKPEGEGLEVPAGAIGWVKLRFKGDKVGRQTVQSRLWMDNLRNGQTSTLELRLTFFDPMRTLTNLDFGVLTQDELEKKPVIRHIICLSPTRTSLELEVSPIRTKGTEANDPVVIGKPVKMTDEECKKLEAELQNPNTELGELGTSKVTCAYRIPVTLKPLADDGKTPFDLGYFRRRVLIKTPAIDNDARSVLIRGRIRGLVELGVGEQSGEINLRVFSKRHGKRESMPIVSEMQGVKLEVDESRLPPFLKASLTPGKPTGDNRPSWMLRVEALPDKASGTFPRKDDPLYEDCAVYLISSMPGKQPRSIRIPVGGTASEG